MPVLQVMQVLVAPVVMISAGGLLCLALYNRLAMIVTRMRLFLKEEFDARTHLSAMDELEHDSVRGRRLEHRVEVLGEQSVRILGRAKLIRGSLMLLLGMVLCMLLCSLALGGSLLWVDAAYVALVSFTVGVMLTMAAMVLAMIELTRALDPVVAERLALVSLP